MNDENRPTDDRQEPFRSRIDLSELHQAVNGIKAELRKIIVGQSAVIEMMIAAILADGHVLLEGVPGVAKTLIAKIMSRVLSIKFARIQFTPDLMPSDVIGTTIFRMNSSEFEFSPGPIFANLVLIDEVNRAPAKTQSALFEVMEERQISVDGHTYQLPPPFIVIATQNPIEQEGTYRLPEAQLDRFLFKIEVGYPDLEEEKLLLSEYHARKSVNDLDQLQPLLTDQQILAFRSLVKAVYIEPKLIAYIAELIHQSRNMTTLYLGGSPRASLSILNSAKAIAAMRGRDFVTPEDIQEIIFPVLRHRLLLTPEMEMEGSTADEQIQRLLAKIEVPR